MSPHTPPLPELLPGLSSCRRCGAICSQTWRCPCRTRHAPALPLPHDDLPSLAFLVLWGLAWVGAGVLLVGVPWGLRHWLGGP